MTKSCDAHEVASVHILVAEDDKVSQLVVKRILEQAGYTTNFVANGNEAIIALKLKNYDLVLMDCFLPQMDGFDATRLIRSADNTGINSKIPVIALTGLTGKDDQRRCLDAGMNAYVGKPVNAGELITTINQCLGRGVDEESVSQQGESRDRLILEDTFLSELVGNFLEEIPRVVNDTRRAIAREDLSGLESIGHRLRGVSDILGVSNLSSRSQALERAGKAGNLLIASELAFELITELQKMEAAITG